MSESPTDFSPENSQPTNTSTRRELLKIAAAAAIGAGGFEAQRLLQKKDSTIETIEASKLSIGSELTVRPITLVEDLDELPSAEDWNEERLRVAIEDAIRESLQSGQEVQVDLPEGEMIISSPITAVVPENARIRLQGNEKGSVLKLDSSLSDISKEWGSFAERSILYFKDTEGEVTVDGVSFHGGSERAGQGGYEPPLSPWDSMLFVVGKGVGETNDDGYRAGEQYDPAMDQAGNRKGKVTVENCKFVNSESGGFMAQNMGEVAGSNLTGKNLDVLFNASWCDDVTASGLVGERFTSDGVYITSAQRVSLENCAIKSGRQGYDLQGVKDAVLRECDAHDCAKAFELTLSETDKKTVLGAVTLIDCNTDGCMQVYSIGPVDTANFEGGKHDNVGDWYALYKQQEPLHSTGIRRAEDIGESRSPIIVYDLLDYQGHPVSGKKSLKFENISMRIGENAPDGYHVPKLKGITYTKA